MGKDKAERQVQFPVDFMFDVYSLLIALERYDLAEDEIAIAEKLKKQIYAKIDAIERQKTFTQYKKSALGSDERESYRREYLKKVEMRESFTTKNEKTFFDEN